MAINVNASNYYTQVIQSANNRQRIYEQQHLISDKSKDKLSNNGNNALELQTIVDSKNAPYFESKDAMLKVYELAHEKLGSQDRGADNLPNSKQSAQLKAYSAVSNMENRDKLQSMLGISVYA